MNRSSTYQSFEPQRSPGRPRGFDPRPDSPAQLAMAALLILLVGALVPAVHVFTSLGLILLLVAGVGYLIRPRSRTMYWRGRELDIGDTPGTARHVYRALFKR